jgi:uncharacterized protein
MALPHEIQGHKYASLTTYRKSGDAVRTAVWFGEDQSKLYVMTRGDAGKIKRIRNNPNVQVAPCTIRGKITGRQFAAKAIILSPDQWPRARKTIENKYWLTRISFLWSKKNVYIEIELTTT